MKGAKTLRCVISMSYPSLGSCKRVDIGMASPGKERTASVAADLWEISQIVENGIACTDGIVGIDAVGRTVDMTGWFGIGIVENHGMVDMSKTLLS